MARLLLPVLLGTWRRWPALGAAAPGFEVLALRERRQGRAALPARRRSLQAARWGRLTAAPAAGDKGPESCTAGRPGARLRGGVERPRALAPGKGLPWARPTGCHRPAQPRPGGAVAPGQVQVEFGLLLLFSWVARALRGQALYNPAQRRALPASKHRTRDNRRSQPAPGTQGDKLPGQDLPAASPCQLSGRQRGTGRRLALPRMGDAEPERQGEDSWIAVVPVREEQAEIPRGRKEESFTVAVVNKMKRALVLGASALLILALNQNTIRELDVSQVLSKPVIVIQTSDNVTRLLGALLRGLRVTAKITYQAMLLENLGVTLTLWSTCGLSRGGLYGEWQGVICTGENSSRVQKYLQQLWNTILFIALILCTGVIVQAQRQSRQGQPDQDTELDLKQHILRRLSALKTRRYHPGKHSWNQARDIDSCVVCLDQFHKNQCLRVLPCSHEFHRDCVDPWLLLQQTCPLCKHNILGNCCSES
ncbi:RING finger protein 215 [Chelonoidis abingdonii]|nr:RING finger protein 215 [Chelonoidis abingdonii]